MARKISAVSTAIKLTTDEYACSTQKSKHTIKIANTLEEREGAFKLSYQVYLEKKFVSPNPQERVINDFDASKSTTIFIGQDQEGNLLGTLTLIFDESHGLPADSIYHQELNTLRQKKLKLTEISRLAIDPKARNSKDILIQLFNYAYIYIYKIQKFDGMIVKVNPRHKVFYKTYFHFLEIGSQKDCPEVNNAPAVLLYLNLQDEYKLLRQVRSGNCTHIGKSVYSQFLTHDQEEQAKKNLANQFRPITENELIYFGLQELDICAT